MKTFLYIFDFVRNVDNTLITLLKYTIDTFLHAVYNKAKVSCKRSHYSMDNP